MTVADLVMRLRSPSETMKTAIVTIVLASMSITGTQAITGIVASIHERVSMPMLERRIDVVRRAAAHVSCPPTVADAPIMQAALDWSLRIQHEQQANSLWYADMFSSDRWNLIEPIAFPCEETP